MTGRLLLWIAAVALAGCFSGFEQGATSRPSAEPRTASASQRPKKKPAKPQQSYREAWQLICHAEKLSRAEGDRATRGAHVAQWIVNHLKNKKARYWFINFGQVKDDRRRAFVQEAKKGGQDDCPLVRLLFVSGSQPAASRPSGASDAPR